jgi:hypothetical protein
MVRGFSLGIARNGTEPSDGSGARARADICIPAILRSVRASVDAAARGACLVRLRSRGSRCGQGCRIAVSALPMPRRRRPDNNGSSVPPLPVCAVRAVAFVIVRLSASRRERLPAMPGRRSRTGYPPLHVAARLKVVERPREPRRRRVLVRQLFVSIDVCLRVTGLG